MAWVSRTALAAVALFCLSAKGSWAGLPPDYDPQGNSYDPYTSSNGAADSHWLMDQQSECWAYDSNAGPRDSITWSGDCRDGRADGQGTLTFYQDGRMFERLIGTLQDGMLADGQVSIQWSDGSRYDGAERQGQFDGEGVLIAADGTRYDGRWKGDNFIGSDNPQAQQQYGASGSAPSESTQANNNYSTDNSESPTPRGNDTSTAALPSEPAAPVEQAMNAPAPPAIVTPQPPAQTQMPLAANNNRKPPRWPFLPSRDVNLEAADGTKLSFTVEPLGVLERKVVHADGSTSNTTLTLTAIRAGTVANDQGAEVGQFHITADRALMIAYGNGRAETIESNGQGGLTITTQSPGSLGIRTDWSASDRDMADNANPAPAPAVAAPVPAAPPPVQADAAPAPAAAPAAKVQVAMIAPKRATPPPRVSVPVHAVAPVVRVAAAPVHVAAPAPVDSPIHPMLKPETTPVEAAEDLPMPRPEPVPPKQPEPPAPPVEVADNLPKPEQKPLLHVPPAKHTDRHAKAHVAVAEATPPAPPPEVHPDAPAMHEDVAPPVVHVTAPPPVVPAPAPVREARVALPPAAPVLRETHPMLAAPPAAPAVREARATPAPAATLATPVVVHIPPPNEPALRRSASDCLTVESNGTHWGFRNNCVTDIQFAYCVNHGSDRLTACGDSAVPGSVAAHGFTSLIADISMKDPSASHAFRWVGCIGGAGEVVPRLDQSDPPMGRCLHASDLPTGVERADNTHKH